MKFLTPVRATCATLGLLAATGMLFAQNPGL